MFCIYTRNEKPGTWPGSQYGISLHVRRRSQRYTAMQNRTVDGTARPRPAHTIEARIRMLFMVSLRLMVVQMACADLRLAHCLRLCWVMIRANQPWHSSASVNINSSNRNLIHRMTAVAYLIGVFSRIVRRPLLLASPKCLIDISDKDDSACCGPLPGVGYTEWMPLAGRQAWRAGEVVNHTSRRDQSSLPAT